MRRVHAAPPLLLWLPAAPTHQGDSAEAAEQRQQASALCRVESSSQLEAGASHSEVSAN